MRFPVIGGSQGLTASPSVTVTTYMPLVYNAQQFFGGTTEIVTQIAVSEACKITDWTVTLGVAPGVGASWQIAIRVNGVTSLATVTISGTATTATISGLSVSLADGDTVGLMLVPSSGTSPAFPSTMSSIAMFETFTSSFFVMGAYLANINTTADNFMPLTGLHGISALNELTKYACPMNGTLDRMRVLCRSTAPGGITGYSLGFRQNGTDTLTATITGANTTALVTGPISISVGDLLDMRAQSINSPTARRLSWCMSFTASNSGDSFLGCGPTVDAGTGNVTNFQPAFGGSSYSTESGRQIPSPAPLVIKNLIAVLAVAPSPGTRTVTMRDNGSSTPLTVSLSGGTTQAQDTTNTATLTGGNATWALQFVSTGTPAAPGVGGISVGYTISTPQATSLVRNVSDSVSFSESQSNNISYVKSLSDSSSFSESLSMVKALKKFVSDSVTFNESLVAQEAFARLLSESIIFNENTSSQKTLMRSLSDSITIAETIGRLLSNKAFIVDSVSLTEVMKSSKSLLGNLTDSITVHEQIILSESLIRMASESLIFAEQISSSSFQVVAAVDSINFSEFVNNVSTLSLDAIDSVSISDAIESFTGFARDVTDSFTVNDFIHMHGALKPTKISLVGTKYATQPKTGKIVFGIEVSFGPETLVTLEDF